MFNGFFDSNHAVFVYTPKDIFGGVLLVFVFGGMIVVFIVVSLYQLIEKHFGKSVANVISWIVVGLLCVMILWYLLKVFGFIL